MKKQPISPSEETHWEMAAKTKMGKYLTNVETNFILKAVDRAKTNLVIDVGAEAGRFSMFAADRKVTVIGIDIDSFSLHRLKHKNQNVNVIQADARKIPLKDSAFDAVFMIEVLDYIPEIDQSMEECCRILKAGCPLLVSFGNQSSLKAKLRGFQGKSYMHSYKKVLRSLKNTGFSINMKMGYSWLPFGRTSQSRFVPLLATLEKLLGLRRLSSLSPWVILCAEKFSSDC